MCLTVENVLPNFMSPSSAKADNDEDGLAVAGSKTVPGDAAVPDNLPLVPTFAICDRSKDKLTR